MEETGRRQQTSVGGRISIDDVIQQSYVAVSGNGGIREVNLESRVDSERRVPLPPIRES